MIGNNQPLVSIIINCYNSDAYLKETLESVLAQTYSNWEVVFWDNQSTDNSAVYFKGFAESRFKYFYAPGHTPLSTARNLAIQKAEGYFLAFLDCDDIWFPEKLAIQVSNALDEDIGFVYSRFDLLIESDHSSARGQAIHYRKLKEQCIPHPKQNLYSRLLLGNYIIFSSVLLKRHIFDSIGGFKNDLSQNEDYELLLKASSISLATCIDYVGVNYRIHAVNNSHLNAERNFIENVAIFSSLSDSKDVVQAKRRNQVKHALFRLFILKDIGALKMLNLFYAPKFMLEILVKRSGHLLKMNVKK